MKLQAGLPLLMTLLGCVDGIVVDWYGCSNEYQRTQTTGTECTNVSGFKEVNLCGVRVGSNYCKFYTTMCGNPWGKEYTCSASSGSCDAKPWENIASYRCYPS